MFMGCPNPVFFTATPRPPRLAADDIEEQIQVLEVVRVQKNRRGTVPQIRSEKGHVSKKKTKTWRREGFFSPGARNGGHHMSANFDPNGPIGQCLSH